MTTMAINKKPTILYVEDELVFTQLFKKALEPYKFEILSAADGTSGAQLYEAQTPDLVFLDINLRGISGFVVLRRIRKFALDNRLNVKIIMLTSNNTIAEIKKAIEYGADDYIVKPFNDAVLIGKIKKYFSDFDIKK